MEINNLTHIQAHSGLNGIVMDIRFLMEQAKLLLTETDWFDPQLALDIIDLHVQTHKKYVAILRKSLIDMGYDEAVIDQAVEAFKKLVNGDS